MFQALKDIPFDTLIREIARRGRLTNAAYHEKMLASADLKEAKIILTRGLPPGSVGTKFKCRECKGQFAADHYSYYQARVSGDSYLQRSNALCKHCSKLSNKQRSAVLKAATVAGKIPSKPVAGSKCPHCKRQWSGNWHRHHIADSFIAWLCGDCNMSFHDQRNKMNISSDVHVAAAADTSDVSAAPSSTN